MYEVACMCYGSNNYHLDGPESDKDYKVLMMPDFDDFYSYHKTEKSDLPSGYDHDHYSVMSVLTFDKHLRKGNFNALEMLFSSESTIDEEVRFYMGLAREAYAKGYIYTVWHSFLSTVEGLIKSSLKRYGANRKSTSRAVFMINFCRFVAENDFIVTRDTWDAALVWAEARSIRFDEDIPIPTEKDIYDALEKMKKDTEHERNYFSLMTPTTEIAHITLWDSGLADCMKNTVRKTLLKEMTEFYEPVQKEE